MQKKRSEQRSYIPRKSTTDAGQSEPSGIFRTSQNRPRGFDNFGKLEYCGYKLKFSQFDIQKILSIACRKTIKVRNNIDTYIKVFPKDILPECELLFEVSSDQS